jgi:16S rRNA (cytidine1402-2'-O)-methyltransferase
MLIIGGVDIGNRKDISPRLVEAICNIKTIVVESRDLFLELCLDLEIHAENIELIEYYSPMDEALEQQICNRILSRLSDNQDVLMLSDDGMPGIADPGGKIVALAHSQKYKVTVIPGPSIVSTLPAVLGLDSRRFTFEDELPINKDERLAMLDKLKKEGRGFLFIVKNRRDHNLLFKDIVLDISKTFSPHTPVGIGINLTMKNEQIIYSSASEIFNRIREYPITQKDFISVYVEASYGQF